MIDLRTPIGIFFVMVGLALVAMPFERAPLTSSMVNLYGGFPMLLFGGVMLWLAWRRR
jgi:hypothetical protein